ncbi:MAG: autotransporter-associated beta strand repeat-containing protein, partial [Verrucomicrobiota bacterium]
MSDGQFSVSNTFNVSVQQTNILSYIKANNTVNLELTNSWVTNAVPDQFGLAVWNNTVTAANITTLGADTDWAGIQVKNPGGLVTINGTGTLGIETVGVDLSGASQNLTLNCPVSLNALTTWNIASGRTVTVNASIGGVGVLTKSGLGTLALASPNTYSGGTTISSSAGATNALLVANSQALGTGTVTIGGSGGTDGSCLRLAGGITFTNTLATWNSRTVGSPNILNVSGNNTLSSDIVVGGSDSQSTLQSDSGTLIMLGDIGSKQLTLQGAGNGELRGVVGSGTWSLVKSGSGMWTLSGDNPYTSATTISGGKLVGAVVGSCSNSAVTVNNTAGCTFGVAITDNTKQWTCDGLTFAGANAKLDFNFGYSVVPSASLAPLQVNGNVTFTGTPGVTIEAGAIPTGPGTYLLLTWTGTASGTAPTTAALPPHIIGTLSVVGSTLQLNITQNNQEPLTWNAGTNIWDINLTGSWKDALGGTGQKYLETTQPGDDVVFNDSGLGGTVTLNVTVTPASVTVSNTLDYTLVGSGAIAGSTGLAKAGAGKLILSTANTYSGATTLGGGTIQVGNGGAAGTLGSGNVVVTAGGTTLAFNRTDTVVSPFIVNNQIYGGSAAIPKIVVNSGAVQLGGAADNSYATAAVKSGATLILAKPSTSSWHCLGGASTVESGGTMQLAGSGGEQIYSAVTLTVQSGGVFELNALNEGF